ncbi:MAG: hypothetical protein AAF657_09750 [Acidobacteriota bacterium]
MDLGWSRTPWRIARRGWLLVLVTLVGSSVAVAQPATPALHLDTEADSAHFGTFFATGLDAVLLDALRRQPPTSDEWRAAFAVFTGTEVPRDETQPAVAGAWAVDGEVLRFRPRYPLVPGLTYSVRLDPGRLQRWSNGSTSQATEVTARFALPAGATEPSTHVARVYPTASELPENLLRLYIHFSAPMGRGEAYEHIRLLDAAGQVVDRPFLEVGEELWDPGMRRLTLFFDPGRIKRGLRPHLEAGPPLAAGSAYRLVIDEAWHDADGLPLTRSFEKAFTVSAADRAALDPDLWHIEAPAAEGQSPLELHFPEPLDHGLLQRVVRIRDANRRTVAGEIEILDEEKRLRFLPAQAWRAGTYAIEVDTILEDVAGNNLTQVFDLDVAVDHATTSDQATISLPFRVAAP